MIIYLEIIEQPNTIEKIPQTIRIEVTDKTDAMNRLILFEPLFADMNYIKQIHYCKHEEKEKCILETL